MLIGDLTISYSIHVVECLQCLWHLIGIEKRDLAEVLQKPLEIVAIVTKAIVDVVEARCAIGKVLVLRKFRCPALVDESLVALAIGILAGTGARPCCNLVVTFVVFPGSFNDDDKLEPGD